MVLAPDSIERGVMSDSDESEKYEALKKYPKLPKRAFGFFVKEFEESLDEYYSKVFVSLIRKYLESGSKEYNPLYFAVVQKANNIWKTKTECDKKKYMDMEEADKIRYDEESDIWKRNYLKEPRNAYTIFRETYQEENHPPYWETASPEFKAKFEKLADKEKEKITDLRERVSRMEFHWGIND
jgi:hypothetical protein